MTISKWYTAGGAIKKLDVFRMPAPGFNVRGSASFTSVPGGLLSFLIINIMVLFSTHKLTHLLLRHNPVVSSFVQQNVLTSEDEFNINSMGMPFAFTIEGFIDKETKDDPRYIKSFARMFRTDNGVDSETPISFH